VLVLLGVIVVPSIRALRTRRDRGWRKLWLSVLALALLAFVLLVPAVAAARGGGFGLAQLLGTPGAAGIPHFGSKAVLLILGAPPAVAIAAAPFPFKDRLGALVNKYMPLSLLYLLLSGFVLGWSVRKISRHFDTNWRAWVVSAVGFAVLVFAGYIARSVLKRTKNPLTLPPL
jgi:hypothetical protein